MKRAKDIDILEKIGEFVKYNRYDDSLSIYQGGMICVNIKEDTMQECIDFVKEEFPGADENRIIQIINNRDLQNEIYDKQVSKDLNHLLKRL